MVNIVVAFPKLEEAKNIKNILMRNGFQVIAVCTSGAQVLNYAEDLGSGIVVCGYRLADMIYEELSQYLPSEFEMLLVASPSRFSGSLCTNIVRLAMPIKVHDLLATLEMMSKNQTQRRRKKRVVPKGRNDEEKELIARAKSVLMEKNNMDESEAHRYIQKCSMDSGTNMVETAQMVLSLYDM